MPPDKRIDAAELRNKIIGLGEKSFRKSYYPELQRRLEDLEQYQTLLDQSNDAIFLIEVPSGCFLSVNRSACLQMGCPEEECYEKTAYDLLPVNRKELEEIFTGKTESMILNTRLASCDSVETPYEVNMRRVTLGNKAYVVAVARDITERKQAEEALLESEEKFRALAESSTAGIFILQGDWLVSVNQTMETITGYPSEELLKRRFTEFIHPDFREVVQERAHGRQRGEPEPPQYEFKITAVSGRVRWVLLSAGRIIYKGKPAVVGTLVDITERKRAEEERERLIGEIDEQRRRLQTILNSLPVTVFIVDKEDRIVLTNPVARSFWGGNFPATMEELAKSGALLDEEGKPFRVAESGLTRALKKGETSLSEVIEVMNPRGAGATMICSVAPIFDARGKITDAAVICQDITEMRELEKELGESKHQAELYLDLMSHDITNMNQALMGYLEMMALEKEMRESDQALIDSSMEVVRRSSRIIEDLKKLTRLQARKMPPKAVDICQILEEVKARYLTVPGREVTINYTPGQGCVVVAGELLKDVFENLVDNAITHSAGPVIISLSVDLVTIYGSLYYVVTVEDNGPGIPDELKKTVFKTLEELEEKTARRGFGLYFVRTVIDYYRGRVWVEDRVPGDYTKGSNFVVQLPSPKT